MPGCRDKALGGEVIHLVGLVLSHEAQQAVRKALGAVPEAYRSAVILRDLEGMAYEEVAEVLAISVGTVKSRILRGRRLLREILEPVLHPAHGASSEALISAAAGSHERSVLRSPFSLAGNETSSGRPDTTGWAFPEKPGDAEGGVR